MKRPEESSFSFSPPPEWLISPGQFEFLQRQRILSEECPGNYSTWVYDYLNGIITREDKDPQNVPEAFARKIHFNLAKTINNFTYSAALAMLQIRAFMRKDNMLQGEEALMYTYYPPERYEVPPDQVKQLTVTYKDHLSRFTLYAFYDENGNLKKTMYELKDNTSRQFDLPQSQNYSTLEDVICTFAPDQSNPAKTVICTIAQTYDIEKFQKKGQTDDWRKTKQNFPINKI